jgi:biotin carboxyl carrier protein
MKLLVGIDGGQAVEFEMEAAGERRRFRFEGRERIASVVETEPGVYSVLVDGWSYSARVRGPVVEISGMTLHVEVRDPRRMGRQSRAGSGEGRQNISSPMPGKVVRVLVAEGDAVEAGQGLIVVEAMKMQNEMRAPRAGRVTELRAREGATVAAAEVLVAIE